jgi:hypothetical protein
VIVEKGVRIADTPPRRFQKSGAFKARFPGSEPPV